MIITIGLIASAIGFLIALYIYRKQHAKKPLMCPRKAPCETVITSPQATTFGFSNTVLGMLYYAFIFFVFICLAMGGRSSIAEIILLILTTGGFLFSLYLVRVQKNIIKQWCLWCLGSALMATILFVTTLFFFI
jgi:uncharacterized membrane protein